MPLPSSSSPFLKSVVAPRLLPFPPASLTLTLTLTPVRRGSSGPGGGGGRRPPPFLPPLRRWITRRPATTRSMPAVRALAPSKSGFRFAGFNSGSDSSSEPNLVKQRGSEPMRLDPAKAGNGEAVNGFCHDKDAPPPRLLTLPTVLTIGRVVAVPLLISTFYMEAPWGTTATTSIFLLAAITDWLDGYIARKMQMGTAFGAFLDPVADKLMVAATLVLLCTKPFEVPGLGELPWLLPVPAIAIIGREITMSAVREWAASQNKKLLEAVAVNNLGKWKTAAQMTALTILLLVRDPSLTGQTTLIASGVALLYVSAGLAVWSLVVYMKKIWKVLIK